MSFVNIWKEQESDAQYGLQVNHHTGSLAMSSFDNNIFREYLALVDFIKFNVIKRKNKTITKDHRELRIKELTADRVRFLKNRVIHVDYLC